MTNGAFRAAAAAEKKMAKSDDAIPQTGKKAGAGPASRAFRFVSKLGCLVNFLFVCVLVCNFVPAAALGRGVAAGKNISAVQGGGG